MEWRPGIWRGLVPQIAAGRLGALSRGSLGLDRALGLELGRRLALGLRPVPLRPVGTGRRSLGLGPGRIRGGPGLCAGARRLIPPEAIEGVGGGSPIGWFPLAPGEVFW